MGIAASASGYSGLAGPVGPHDIYGLAAVACRAEGYEAAVRRPSGVFIASFAGKLHVILAVGCYGIDLKTALLATVEYAVSFRRPAGTHVV